MIKRFRVFKERRRKNRIRRYWLDQDNSRIRAGFTSGELLDLREHDYKYNGRPKWC